MGNKQIFATKSDRHDIRKNFQFGVHSGDSSQNTGAWREPGAGVAMMTMDDVRVSVNTQSPAEADDARSMTHDGTIIQLGSLGTNKKEHRSTLEEIWETFD